MLPYAARVWCCKRWKGSIRVPHVRANGVKQEKMNAIRDTENQEVFEYCSGKIGGKTTQCAAGSVRLWRGELLLLIVSQPIIIALLLDHAAMLLSCMAILLVLISANSHCIPDSYCRYIWEEDGLHCKIILAPSPAHAASWVIGIFCIYIVQIS